MIHSIIQTALQEDLGDGDHSSLACIPADAKGEAKLLVKDTGILAGVDLARLVCETYDPSLQFEELLHDGDTVTPGQIAFYIRGKAQSILAVERILLNFMQRMSGIATVKNQLVKFVRQPG